MGKRGPALSEYFAQDRPPFRCDRPVYDAVAGVLAEQTESVRIEHLLRGVRKNYRADLPDYLVRECLRFWLSRDPPLIEKVGTRYIAVYPKTLRREASKDWNALENEDR